MSRPCWASSARPAGTRPSPARPSSVFSAPGTGSPAADLGTGYRCPAAARRHTSWRQDERPCAWPCLWSGHSTEDLMTIDQDKLMDFLHKFVGDLGATMAAGNVLVGDRLGLYRALADRPLLPHELAERTGTATRYVDEWLRGQAA